MAPPLDPKVGQGILDDARQLYDDAKASVQARMPEWLESAAFYKGDQWGQQTALGYMVSPEDPDAPRETINLTTSIVRTAVAEMLQYIPSPEVCAGSDDPEQIARARYAHRVVRSWLRDGTLDFSELERAVIASKVFGVAYICAYFDPNAGKESVEYLWRPGPEGTFEPVVDEFGQQMMRPKFPGRLRMRACNPFEVYAAPTAQRWSEAWYVVERVDTSQAEAEDTYPLDAYGQPSQFATSPGAQEEAGLRQVDEGLPFSYAPGTRSKSNRRVEIVRLYRRPSRRYPRGLFVAWSGPTLLAAGPLGTWPWVQLLGDERGFGMYPKGLVAPIVGQQRLYNKHMTILAEDMAAHAPGMLIPRQAKLAIDDVGDRPGWSAEYNVGFAPHPYQQPDLPVGIANLGEMVIARMKDTSTVSDISRGVMPEGAESGAALQYLHESQRGVHGPEVQHFQLAVLELLRIWLRLAELHFTDGREMVILGENDAWTSEAFRREGMAFDVDLAIEPMSGAPQSKALREDSIVRAVQFEILAPEEGRRMLAYDSLDRNAYDPDEAHRSEARRENFVWRKDPLGEAMELEALVAENHVLHMEEHNKERCSPLYKQRTPVERYAIDAHYEMHLYMHLQQIQGFAAQENAGGGGGAPPEQEEPGESTEEPENPAGLGGTEEPDQSSQAGMQPVPRSAPQS